MVNTRYQDTHSGNCNCSFELSQRYCWKGKVKGQSIRYL